MVAELFQNVVGMGAETMEPNVPVDAVPRR